MALHFFFTISLINVFISPKQNDIYYSIDEKFNVTTEITFPITLTYYILNLTFFHCEVPTLNTEIATFNIGMRMALTFSHEL